VEAVVELERMRHQELKVVEELVWEQHPEKRVWERRQE
jgi:hypothetical protein